MGWMALSERFYCYDVRDQLQPSSTLAQNLNAGAITKSQEASRPEPEPEAEPEPEPEARSSEPEARSWPYLLVWNNITWAFFIQIGWPPGTS